MPDNMCVYCGDLHSHTRFDHPSYPAGEMIQSTEEHAHSFAWHFPLFEPPPSGTRWYAKPVQENGEAAYSALIWNGQTDRYDVLVRDNMWNSRAVPSVSPNVGSEGHRLLVTSSNDGERDQVLLISNSWPTLGTPVPLDIASYREEGIALEPEQNWVWVTSVSGGLVSVVQDGEPVCSPVYRDDTLR